MDSLGMHAYKIQAICKKHKRQQFVCNVLLYSLSTLACTLFCSCPLCYPPFSATINVVLFVSLPEIINYDTYKCKIPDRQLYSNHAIKLYDEAKSYEEKILKSDGGDQEERVVDVSLPADDELKKLADNFIARINTQRRLEAELCRD
ncbi:hypothetical protein L6452_07385 [Arctium lappa]|uniref:Uncharacterized protein n=1 Tax=Arctium lappa TaxID=4217 RepID=A0ACB9ELA6_ARCLA|nr:hypothetical protein L6452_07385 [Arctium lappa]